MLSSIAYTSTITAIYLYITNVTMNEYYMICFVLFILFLLGDLQTKNNL